MFGLTSIYLIFSEDVDFYWARARILEKLSSLPGGVLPEGVAPGLGPDATGLGQVFWYTLEGRDPSTGEAVGGWGLDELRSIQDFTVRYALQAADGVAEIASIGGYVREYQVELDPEAMRLYDVTIENVMAAIRDNNLDVGASTLEINLAEYFVRGLGYLKSVDDLEAAVVRSGPRNIRITLGQVARVQIGPAERRGLLDKGGAEAVGGVVIARYGSNPLAIIESVKAQIAQLGPGLPRRQVDGRTSQVTLVPFYDRSRLIHETIGTLEEALTLEVLITAIVVILMLLNVRSSLLVAGLLPVAVLTTFIGMKVLGIDANIVALSGIAIAIGTMVDMGIVLAEAIIVRLDDPPAGESLTESIFAATQEVAGAVLTAVATTVVSFLPVFTMEAAEGKLFGPLAYTKTLALIAAILVTLALLPACARALYSFRQNKGHRPKPWVKRTRIGVSIALALLLCWLLAEAWMPLGPTRASASNFLFIILLVGGLVLLLRGVIQIYEPVLRFLLRVKLLFLAVVGLILFAGYRVYQQTGEEFMPTLGEGTFLLMPTTTPHAGVEANLDNLRLLDMAVQSIPEVELVVGKAGRADTPLDPAPLSMYENVIQYASEFRTDADGRRLRYAYDDELSDFLRDSTDQLIPDPSGGRYFRNWRQHITSPDDIWDEISRVTSQLPGLTGAPKLQPIETRLVMLQTGMRAPMGIKVYGQDLATLEAVGIELGELLREVDGVRDAAVFADRTVGKPYLLIDIDRDAISRYGLSITDVQRTLRAAVGGMALTTTVEGRERYAVRLRYPRDLRDGPQSLMNVLVATRDGTGAQVPLGQLAEIRYEQGPQSIKSEDGFLVSYVLFDRVAGSAEVPVVEAAQAYIAEAIEDGRVDLPPGVSYAFAGNYEQQVRASSRLALVVPIALALIFVILYLQFRSVALSLMVFSGVAVAFAGGFLLIGAYANPGFLDFEAFGLNFRELFRVQPLYLSVAVWVGFLALFGIATDDGVLVGTFLQSSFRENQPQTRGEIREAVVEAGLRRVRPATMTTATTILALLPVLTSTGRGAEIMVPMAVPTFGGMLLQVLTMFTVPVLFSMWHEWKLPAGPSFLSKLKSKLGLGAASVLALYLAGITTTPAAAQSLDSLTSEMLRQHPDLRALQLGVDAARQEVEAAGQLPDTEFGLGFLPSPVETRVGPQLLRVGVTQRIPWPGLRPQQRDLASAQIEPEAARLIAPALVLRSQLARPYYEVAALDARAQVYREQLQLLQTLRASALANASAGTRTTLPVYEIELRTLALEERLALLDPKRQAARRQVYLASGQPVEDSLRVDGLEELIADSLLVPPYSALAEALNAKHPLLQVYAARAEVERERAELATLEAPPDFALGADYLYTGRRTDADPMGNGRDAAVLRIGMRLPINRDPYKAREQAARLRAERLRVEAGSERLHLLDEAAMAYASLKASQISLASLDKQLALLDPAIRVAAESYARAQSPFADVIQLFERRLSLELERIRAYHQRLNAEATLTKLLAL